MVENITRIRAGPRRMTLWRELDALIRAIDEARP
jgi:hypothetical protein